MSLFVYDGKNDIKAPPTTHTLFPVSVGKITAYRDSITVRKNGRADWSLFYCEKGCIYFDDRTLTAGQLWIYPPDTFQRYKILCKDGTVYYYLHFNGSDVKTLVLSLGLEFAAPLRPENKVTSSVFDKIKDDIQKGDTLSMLDAECLIIRLISALAKTSQKTNEDTLLKSVLDDMEHSFAEAYDVKKYADMMYVSTDRFNHLFKEKTGVSPYSHYCRLRIENACMLLKNTNLKIKDIASLCGFDSALYFTQSFKKQTAVTPSAYRKLY